MGMSVVVMFIFVYTCDVYIHICMSAVYDGVFNFDCECEVEVVLSVSRICAGSWQRLCSLWFDLVLICVGPRHVCVQSGWESSLIEDEIFITTTN